MKIGKYFTLTFLIFFLMIGFVYGYEKKPDDNLTSVKITANPKQLTFNCKLIEKYKKILATNMSKERLTINATSVDDWIIIEPPSHTDVPFRGKVFFNVGVDCKKIKSNHRITGKVIISDDRGFNSIPILIIVNPGPESLPKKMK